MNCECGCGQPAPIAKTTRRKLGHIKGQPVRYRIGHAGRGRKMPFVAKGPRSPETRAKIAASLRGRKRPEMSNEKHWAFKGAEASYSALHHWMQRNHPRVGVCEECGATGRTEWANLDHRYRRVRDDWRELCCLCHRRYDAGLISLKEHN